MSTKVFHRAKKTYLSRSPAETQKIAGRLAGEILKKTAAKKAVLIGLKGELGSGKTTFLQGFAKGLGIKEKVLSPTFVLMKRLKLKTARFKNFYHIDCYRIKEPKEIQDLGFREIVSSAENIICIEWADKIKKILPKETLWLKFQFQNKTQRKIIAHRGEAIPMC